MGGAVVKRGLRHPTNRFARRGVAVVELALVMPIFLLLVFGIIEFGYMFFVHQGLINAARVGARTATLPIDEDDRMALVIARTEAALRAGQLEQFMSPNGNLTITYVQEGSPSNAHIVTVSVPYSDVSLVGELFFGWTTFDLSSSCAMFRAAPPP